MAELETACEDVKAWTRYGHKDDDDGDVWIYRRCPECGKYLKAGEVLLNMAGDAILKGWICKQHREVEPFYLRD